MLKFIVLAILFIGLYWLIRKGSFLPGGGSSDTARSSRPSEAMLICQHCGVRFPESEAVVQAGKHFCCEEHRRAGTD